MKNLDKVYAEKIAEEYAPKKTSKVVALRKLDQKVKKPINISALTIGIIGTLIFGTGMTLAMGEIGPNNTTSMILGCIIGVIGMIIVSINYLVYKKILASRKAKYAFEITELAKEITNEEE